MPALLALQVLLGLTYTARRALRERVNPADDVGLSTLEIVIIILGLMALAAALVVVLTAAVNRRLDQIN